MLLCDVFFRFLLKLFLCYLHVIQDSLCFVSWLKKSDIGDFDSLSTFFKNKKFWSFSSPHEILAAFMIAGTYQRETLHQSVCNSSMFQSIHGADQWNNRLWRGKSVKCRDLLHSTTYMSLFCITPFISEMISFLSHSVHVFLSFSVLLSCSSLWTLYKCFINFIYSTKVSRVTAKVL